MLTRRSALGSDEEFHSCSRVDSFVWQAGRQARAAVGTLSAVLVSSSPKRQLDSEVEADPPSGYARILCSFRSRLPFIVRTLGLAGFNAVVVVAVVVETSPLVSTG